MSRGCLGLLALLASLGRADPTWRPLPFPLAPAPRWVHAMAWDPLRERVIVFGGVTWGAGGRLERDHFWAWDGASWRFLPASPGPALRLAALAFEPARGRAVVYGLGEGYDAVETWVWDGTRWERRFPQAQPPRLCGIGMVHDEARARSVLVGYDCFQNTSTNAHTWEWDGSDWRGGVSHLPARFSHALGYDATRRRTIALGGILPYVPSPLVSDVWEYDGIRWTQVAQLPGSPAAGTWAMAHDPARRTNLVVGSTAGETQTWEWDGTSWRRASTAPPFVASGQGLVHDPRRGRTVLFGGFERSPGNATWEWDGSNWSRRTAERPVARVGASMTFDVARRRFVLFGGKADLESYALTDLWELTEGVWERRTFRAAPLARLGAAMAHDLSRGRTVLFGGTVGCPLPGFPCAFEDTWEWDGNIWQERAPSVRPPARFAHAMTWDGARARVLLFGGIDVRGAALADTWEWDGSAWLRRFPVHAPPPLHEHGMAFDEARGVVVLLDSGTPPSTWEWDGSDWTERRPPVSPPVGGGPLAYDRERRRTLFFAPDARSWEWDGQTWSLLATPEPPPPRRFHALAHDPVGRRTILFGGLGDGGTLGDTWELRDPCPVAGPGHPGGGLPVECRGAARPGGTLCVSFSLPPPRGAGFSLLLLAPGSALDPPREVLPPAVCRAALLHVLPVSVRSAGGEPAVFCLGLPDHPALAGQSFTLQGAAFETAGCFTATDAITARIAP